MEEWDTDRDNHILLSLSLWSPLTLTLVTQCTDPTPVGTGVDQEQGEEAERVPVLEEDEGSE